MRFVFLRIAAFACLAVPGYCSQRWISVTNSHFEMFTDNSEKQAERALQTFEQVRYFFLQNSKGKQGPDGRVRIIAFSSEREFKPFRPNAGTFAYYQQSHERDYIVMQDIDPEHSRAAMHEYTHLILRHLKLDIPLWLEEGMADFYSSLEPRGDKAMVGRALNDHLMLLNNQLFIDWNVLFNVNHDSPYYNQPDKMPMFYAQSWALTHMLELGPGYSANFGKFLTAVSNGTPTAEALEKVYGKSVAEVGKEVQSYIHQATMKAFVFDVKLSKTDLEPQVSDLSPFQTELAFADLLSTRPQTAPEAQQRMLALERQNPGSVELQESLGYLAWQQNNTPDALKHFGLAVDHGSQNAEMILQYAELSRSSNASTDDAVKLAEKSLAIQPENVDARMFLADTLLSKNSYEAALSAFAPIHKVKPDQAFRFFAIHAIARANLKDYKGGKADALSALKYADAPEQRQNMTNLMEFIDSSVKADANNAEVNHAAISAAVNSSAAPNSVPKLSEERPTLRRTEDLPRAQGKTKSFECVKGSYRLHIEDDSGRELVFLMPDPKDVVVRNTESGMIEWSCGPLKPQNITVVYKPAENDKGFGVVSELIF